MPSVVQIIIPAFLLDCLLGDPRNPLHPIRIIGRMISWGIDLFQYFRIKNPAGQFVSGAVLAAALVLSAFFATKYAIEILFGLNPRISRLVEIVLCYFLIARKALRDESMKVCRDLRDGDLDGARRNLSRIVGRDTEDLDAPDVVRATVETVGENFSDGVIAPLFFVCLGGVPLGAAYKAVNTLDSMIGYRNEKFEYFGKCAARLDDAANYIPARLSAFFLLTSVLVTKKDFRSAFSIFCRDRFNHKSPNSAQTEAVCAGALGLRLGGDGFYAGKRVSKPTIGDDLVRPEPSHIVAVNRLMSAATLVGIVFMLLAAVFAQYAWRCFDV